MREFRARARLRRGDAQAAVDDLRHPYERRTGSPELRPGSLADGASVGYRGGRPDASLEGGARRVAVAAQTTGASSSRRRHRVSHGYRSTPRRLRVERSGGGVAARGCCL